MSYRPTPSHTGNLPSHVVATGYQWLEQPWPLIQRYPPFFLPSFILLHFFLPLCFYLSSPAFSSLYPVFPFGFFSDPIHASHLPSIPSLPLAFFSYPPSKDGGRRWNKGCFCSSWASRAEGGRDEGRRKRTRAKSKVEERVKEKIKRGHGDGHGGRGRRRKRSRRGRREEESEWTGGRIWKRKRGRRKEIKIDAQKS